MSHIKKTQDEIRRQIDSVIIPLAKVQTVRKKAGKKPVPVPPENRFPPDPRKGLSTNQVSERMLQGKTVFQIDGEDHMFQPVHLF